MCVCFFLPIIPRSSSLINACTWNSPHALKTHALTYPCNCSPTHTWAGGLKIKDCPPCESAPAIHGWRSGECSPLKVRPISCYPRLHKQLSLVYFNIEVNFKMCSSSGSFWSNECSSLFSAISKQICAHGYGDNDNLVKCITSMNSDANCSGCQAGQWSQLASTPHTWSESMLYTYFHPFETFQIVSPTPVDLIRVDPLNSKAVFTFFRRRSCSQSRFLLNNIPN